MLRQEYCVVPISQPSLSLDGAGKISTPKFVNSTPLCPKGRKRAEDLKDKCFTSPSCAGKSSVARKGAE